MILRQLIGTIAGATLALWLSRYLYRLTFDRAALGAMLRFSIPLVPSGIGVLVTLYIDRVAIRTLMTIADVGLFGIGYRIASITGLLMVGFQVALTPLIYANYRDPRMPDELATIFRAFVGFAVLIILGLGPLFAREILVIVATPTFYPAAAVVPLLAPALLLSSMYVFAPGLAIAKRTGPIAAIHISSALLNTALNLTLIPLLGISGAALATAPQRNLRLRRVHGPQPAALPGVARLGPVGAGCDRRCCLPRYRAHSRCDRAVELAGAARPHGDRGCWSVLAGNSPTCGLAGAGLFLVA